MQEFLRTFEETFLEIIQNESVLYSEEQLMTLMYFNEKNKYSEFYFEIWWHEDNVISGVDEKFISENKSFYKSLEDIKK
jgi:UDP-N-acetyl-D-mannosaminuronate dehydrogenase